jgi:hypothetical protein
MRTIVFLALVLFAAAARADLVKVAESDDATYYVDPATISVGEAYRRVSVIHDYANSEPGGMRSRLVSYDVDCTEERLRSTAVIEFSDAMAKGRRLGASQRESEWLYVTPQTGTNLAVRNPYWSIVRFVCAR